MAYILKQVTIRANNTKEGMSQIDELWRDIMDGKFPALFNSNNEQQSGVFLVSKYNNYESDEKGEYDLSIIGTTVDFMQALEVKVVKGVYKKYDMADEGGNIGICAKRAWDAVWNDQALGVIKRAFTVDYETSTLASYSKDGKAHCCLYIAIK